MENVKEETKAALNLWGEVELCQKERSHKRAQLDGAIERVKAAVRVDSDTKEAEEYAAAVMLETALGEFEIACLHLGAARKAWEQAGRP